MNLLKPISVGRIEIGTGMPKICVPITGKTKEEVLHQAVKIKEKAPDLVEWRGDLFEAVLDEKETDDVLEALHQILGEIPLLFTFRTAKEGGNRDLTLEAYVALNLRMAGSPFISLVDVEIYRGEMEPLITAIKAQGKVVIGSHHRFDLTPTKDEMVEVLAQIEKNGADILKLAVMPHSEEDVELLLQATNEAVCIKVNHPVVTMSMGTLGLKSRICGKIYGSAITFACVGEASAPGQIEIGELRNAMNQLL